MAVTQKTIAGKVGVSQKTVSLYFKGSRHIAPETAARIKKIAEQYGYFPNLAAMSMKTKCFKRIAMVVVQHYRTQESCHPQLLAYMNAAAIELADNGYSLVLEPFGIDLQTQQFVEEPNFFKTLSVDGILGLAGSYVPPIVDETIAVMGQPIVWLNRSRVAPDIPNISFDEEENGRILARYLKDQGYKHIAWFGPEFVQDVAKHYSSQSRFNGVNEICTANNIELTHAFARVGVDLGDAVPALFNKKPLPQAIICYNHDYMDTAVHAMYERGLRHPADIEMVKFSSPWEKVIASSKFYTSLVLPENDLSKRGAKYILGVVSNRRDDSLLEPLTGELVVRK
jgi:DNA-binding LacI/PurR family transcriptional regulator